MTRQELLSEIQYLESMNDSGLHHDAIIEKAISILNIQEIQIEPLLQVKVHLVLASSYYFTSKLQLALEASTKAYQISLHSENQEFLSTAINAMANIQVALSHYAEAIQLYKQSIDICTKNENKFGLAGAFSNMGLVFRTIGEYDLALECMDNALILYEQIGNTHGIATITGNIGNLYMVMTSYQQALEYMHKALLINEELNDIRGIAANCISIGGVYIHLDQLDLAETFLHRSLDLSNLHGDKLSHVKAKSNLGIILFKKQRYEEALKIMVEVSTFFQDQGYESEVAIQNISIGRVYADPSYSGHDPEKAKQYYMEALNYCKSAGLKRMYVELYLDISKLYEQLGDFENSLAYFKEHINFEKEILSEKTRLNADILHQKKLIKEHEKERVIQHARNQEQERILLKMLPTSIANRIIKGESQIVDVAESVSIFFSDIVNFTSVTSEISPDILITELNALFSEFDRIAQKHNVEKIKTIGDSYMAVCGVPESNDHHALHLAEFANEVMNASKNHSIGGHPVRLRIGMHTGRAIAGIIGEDKYSYDLWGDVVNTASRMETLGIEGKIQVSEDFKKLIESYPHIECVPRGEIEVKGKGKMTTYLLEFVNQSNNA